MALPRRGTRTITIDAHRLRWLARSGPDGFLLVVERHTDPGRKALITLPRAAFGMAPPVVSPEIVRQCVSLAMAQGFDPDAPAGQVVMRVAPGDLRPEQVDREALTPRPVGRPRKRAPGEKRRPVYVSLDKPDRARLERAAEAAGVPIGTLARLWLLERLADEEREA